MKVTPYIVSYKGRMFPAIHKDCMNGLRETWMDPYPQS